MSRYTIADSSLFQLPYDKGRNYRGLNVFTLSELRGVTGVTKKGDFMTGTIQSPIFTLSPEERMGIMQASAYVQAVVSSRMNRISSLEWDIILKKEVEDQMYVQFKDLKQIHDEHDDMSSLEHLLLRYKIRNTLRGEIPELRDDLKNFDTAMLRHKKRINREVANRKDEIVTWLNEANMEDDFADWVKKWVESLMVHGASTVYKEYEGKTLDNFYVLPGGTTYPLRTAHVGSYVAYAQIITGYMPKVYFQDEITFTNYLPSSARSYGYVPLDALINKVSEQLLFDNFAAERADGTKEPEKLIIFGDTRSLFAGDMTGDVTLPMDTDEQRRIEDKVNSVKKGAVATLSGVGHPVVEDISKADTFAAQSVRQDKLLRDIALVFNMTNMEINLAGGEFTSGKETSETQGEIEEGKGTRPIIQKIQSIINKSILPFRFGSNYIFKYNKALTPFEQVKLDTMKANSMTYTKNEIRIDRGDEPILEEGNDTLKQEVQGEVGSSPFNPINTRAIDE